MSEPLFPAFVGGLARSAFQPSIIFAMPHAAELQQLELELAAEEAKGASQPRLGRPQPDQEHFGVDSATEQRPPSAYTRAVLARARMFSGTGKCVQAGILLGWPSKQSPSRQPSGGDCAWALPNVVEI